MQIPSEQPTPKSPPLLLNPVLADLPAYPLARLDERRRRLEEEGTRLFDFGTGDPREPTDPNIRQSLIDNVPEVSRYPAVAGVKELREAFSGFMGRRHRVKLDPDLEVLPAAGSKEAIFHAPLAFVHPSHDRRGVAYGTPGYPVYERGALFAGGEALPVRLRRENGFLLDVEDLDPGRLRALWINYPHNPTGARASYAYLEEVASYCREHDVLLFSDECYNDVYDHGATPPPSILEVSRDRTLAFVSLSKRSGITGYRAAMMAGDPELIAALKKLRPSIGAASPTFIQKAATAAWNDDAHVERRNRVFAEKRALLAAFFERAGLRFTRTDASLYLWVEVPAGYDDEAYALRLLEEGIVVAPGSSFGPGGEGFFRVALVPTLEECEEAVARWETLTS